MAEVNELSYKNRNVMIGRVAFKNEIKYSLANGDLVILKPRILYDFYDDSNKMFKLIVGGDVVDISFDETIDYCRYIDGLLYVTPLFPIDDDRAVTRFKKYESYRVIEETETEYLLCDITGNDTLIAKNMFKIDFITGFDFHIYQDNTKLTAVYPKDRELEYLGFGLVGEAGELANKFKKIFRDDNGKLTDERRDEIKSEIGDILWYAAQLCNHMDTSMSAIARENLSKLRSRQAKKTLHGSGDRR